VSFDKSGEELHNFIRSLDSVPGAWIVLNGEEVRILFTLLRGFLD
jgi:methionyl-tRNA formyltransferase